ncbi:MAG: hypothetical protein ABGZ53_14715 [Fuerstiella sp.]
MQSKVAVTDHRRYRRAEHVGEAVKITDDTSEEEVKFRRLVLADKPQSALIVVQAAFAHRPRHLDTQASAVVGAQSPEMEGSGK